MASLPDRFPPGVAALRPQQEEDAGPGSLQEEDRERWKVAAAAKVFSSNGRRKEVAGGGRFSSGTSLSRLYHHHRRRRRRVRGLIRLGFNHEANRSKELIKTLRNYHVHTSAICVLLASCYEEARMKAMQHLLAGSPLHHGQTSACTVRTRVSCTKIKYYFFNYIV